MPSLIDRDKVIYVDVGSSCLYNVYQIVKQAYMPTVLRVGRYRFLFFSNEGIEPPHIHVKADGDEAKFWLDPIALAANYGFRAHELNEAERLVHEYRIELMEAWHEHLG